MFGLADVQAARGRVGWLWSELSIAVELSGAASVAALFNGSVKTRPGENVCALVCGAGRDGWT